MSDSKRCSAGYCYSGRPLLGYRDRWFCEDHHRWIVSLDQELRKTIKAEKSSPYMTHEQIEATARYLREIEIESEAMSVCAAFMKADADKRIARAVRWRRPALTASYAAMFPVMLLAYSTYGLSIAFAASCMTVLTIIAMQIGKMNSIRTDALPLQKIAGEYRSIAASAQRIRMFDLNAQPETDHMEECVHILRSRRNSIDATFTVPPETLAQEREHVRMRILTDLDTESLLRIPSSADPIDEDEAIEAASKKATG